MMADPNVSLEGLDDHLAQKAQAARERALVAALAAALKVVEVADLAMAIRIVDRLSAAVLPLPGEAIRLDCGELIPLAQPLEPVEELDVALITLQKFNQARKKLAVDMNEHAGGSWLNEVRRAAEKLRRAAFKAKKKSNLTKKKGGDR